MKKILFFLTLFIAVLSTPSYAQTGTIPMPTLSLTPTPAPTIIIYELPYPGILPGSPLYTLKALRDRITEIFTSDPVKKANFYLLQADKRLAAALILSERGEGELAETTLSKSQNYLEKSINKMIETKKSRENVGDIFAKLKNSSAKQRQEIEILSKKAKGEEAQKLIADYKRAQQLENRVNSFDP